MSMVVEEEALARQLSEAAADIIARLVREGAIDRSALLNYGRASEANLHGWLQYALIKAADVLGLAGIPEARVKLGEPLNPEEFLPGRDGRRRWQKRVDVGFFLRGRFLGFGECFTLDEFHGCISTRELVDLLDRCAREKRIDPEKVVDVRKMWIAPRDTIIHMVENARAGWKPRIAILVLTLPDDFGRVKLGSNIHHRLLAKKGASFFVERWRRFLEELRERGLHAHLIRVTDAAVELDGQARAFFSERELEKRAEEWARLAVSLDARPFSEPAPAGEGGKWLSDEYAERKLGLR